MFGLFKKKKKKANSLPEFKNAPAPPPQPNAYERRRARIRVYADIITKDLEEVEKSMMEDTTWPNNMGKGTDIILNIYDMLEGSSNGWDLGAPGMVRRFKPTEKLIPYKAKSKGVYVSWDYVSENIDKFLDLKDGVDKYPPEDIAKEYRKWFERVHRSDDRIFTKYGLYYKLKFEPNESFDFKPKYGLCAVSFLPLGTVAGDKTEKLWKQEGELLKLKLKLQMEETSLKRTVEDFTRTSGQYLPLYNS